MSALDDLEPGQTWQVGLTSDTANLARLRETISTAAGCVGFDEPVIAQIVLAVDEAIGNVIKHGYEGRAGLPIEVTIESTYRMGSPALQVTICDCGRQVEPDSIVGRELEDVRPGGLGTHIIRHVMDEVEYSVRQPQGMSLRMVKLCGAGGNGNERCCQAEDSGDG
jgi:anti-sigma regulatory factor (Ser/Thr protein kinase)